ncbi:MAG TPA: diaminopimelate epimerase [Solirubrobacteraceae bacterium]|nr:diaminopimelate epimerase [Solirubrobacteraceae bacterium]
MAAIRFEKWQALGNDYVIVEHGELPFELTPARIRRLCAGHFGVGADGVLLLSRPANPAHVADLRIFNPDGSEAELSGNGAREAIIYLRRRGWTDADAFTINTLAGEIHPTITGPHACSVEMGRASLTSKDYPGGPPDGRGVLGADGREWSFRHVSIGNPQCAIRVGSQSELERLDLDAIGPSIERSALFPNRTNVSWYAELAGAGEQPGRADSAPGAGGTGGHARVRARIFERGVGETLASGTGASGAAVAYTLEGDERASGPASVTVLLDGGELQVRVGEDLSVNLTGWARPVFAGRLSEDFEKELHETE